MRVKICGITNLEDAQLASRLGAWALGFIFYKKSPRFVSAQTVKKITQALAPFVTTVGVFVNEKEGAIQRIAENCRLDAIQLHGDESPAFCRRLAKQYKVIKAARIGPGFDFKRLADYPVSALLFDTWQKDSYGGSGKIFNWNLLKGYTPNGAALILSGGLNADNVKQAVEQVHPYAVDVSSGVEAAPGKKSKELLINFFNRIQ